MPSVIAHAHAPMDPTGDIESLIGQGEYRAATAACAQHYGAVLGRLCFALLGSQADAEEAVQETLLAAYHSLPNYEARGKLRPWLFAIARRQCAGRYRRAKRDAGATADWGVDEIDPALSLERAQSTRRLRRALDRLKAIDREILTLRYQGELSYREIATILALDESATRKRASRSVLRLREFLRRKDNG